MRILVVEDYEPVRVATIRSLREEGYSVDDASDFDHAYVFESQARALASLGRLDEAGEAYQRAAAVQIADDQDRAIVKSDLAAEPWYGLPR